jgi:hypothetical protein
MIDKKLLFKLLIGDGVWQTHLKRKYVGSNAYIGDMWINISGLV